MDTYFTSFEDVQRHLDSLGLFHMDFSLRRMENALRQLGLTRPSALTVQVLGTNGKGSTSAFLAALGLAHGCKTGLYASPHFLSPLERIRINGEPLPREEWPAIANAIMEVEPELTYFEFLTVLAMKAFAGHGAELIVLEAGLGGKSDATTAICADALCFTPIAMDHAAIIGPTLQDIARDKAGAIRPAVPVFSTLQFPVAENVLRETCRRLGASFTIVPPLPSSTKISLAGAHQFVNASLALAAWQSVAARLGKKPDDVEIQNRAFATAFIPGRLQLIQGASFEGQLLPPFLLDGAHNPHGMQALSLYLKGSNIRPRAVIYSALGDKDWIAAARMLRHTVGNVPFFVVELHNQRAARTDKLAEAINSLAPAVARPVETLEQALAHCLEIPARAGVSAAFSPVLVCGSLYLLAELYERYPDWLLPPVSEQG